MRKLVLAAAAVLMLAGCTTAERSAVVGGATGAAIGGVATGDAGGALVGGAVGALAGSLIGRAAESNYCIYENRWGQRYRARCP